MAEVLDLLPQAEMVREMDLKYYEKDSGNSGQRKCERYLLIHQSKGGWSHAEAGGRSYITSETHW